MRPFQRFILVGCLLLTACASSSPAATPTGRRERLPTRMPTATPTATPVALSAADYWQRGVELQRSGDLDRAERYFDWAIQIDSSSTPFYVSRGSLHLADSEPDRALQDADTALKIDPTSEAYLLRAEALRAMDRHEEALRAFDQALARDADLRDRTFRSRWLATRALEDLERLSALAAEYASAHPSDPLRYYYQAWPSFESDEYRDVIHLLVEGIEDSPDSLAVLWYVLGRAYAGIEAWPEAILSLERARELVEAGDTSLAAHGEQPVAELFIALGRAYLGADRCSDAETMLAYGLSIGAPMEKHLAALEEARRCSSSSPSTATPVP